MNITYQIMSPIEKLKAETGGSGFSRWPSASHKTSPISNSSKYYLNNCISTISSVEFLLFIAAASSEQLETLLHKLIHLLLFVFCFLFRESDNNVAKVIDNVESAFLILSIPCQFMSWQIGKL